MATETDEPIRTVRPESVENGQEKCPGFSYEEGAKKTTTWLTYKRKRETPASDSQSAKTKMGQKMALVHQSLSLLSNDSRHVEPHMTVRPESVENGQEKCPGFFYQEGAKKTTTWITYTRKRGGLAGSRSAKQKSVLFDDNINRSSYSNVDKDENFVPHTPTRKRRRPTCSKCSKRKVERKPQLVERSSSSEGNKDNNNAFEPEVSHHDDGRKKHTRVKGTAWDRAVELKKKLRGKGPSFIKRMKRSHVSGGYWLGLPAESCRNHLPTHDVNMALEDEEGRISGTKYLADRTGLSGGWRGFAIKHELKVGDALVFQLVRQGTFKVYILRADGALCLPSLDTCMGNNRSSKKKEKEGSDEGTKPKKKRKVLRKEASGDCSDKLVSKEATLGGIRSPRTYTDDFAAVKSFEDFKIAVGDGLLALPDRMRMTYYHLCKARKAFLHRHASPALAAEMIVETIKIADGIRASSSIRSLEEDLAAWKKTLVSFEPQGMDVAFMRERIDDLQGILSAPSSSSATLEPEGYEEVKAARAHAAKRLRALESTVSALKDALEEIDAEMEEMEESVRKKKDQAVWKLATAPWCVNDNHPGTPGSDPESREDSSIGKTKNPRPKRATRLPGWLAGHEFGR